MAATQDLNESLPLDAESMPECWDKDDRMNSLFAQFRNRSVNPQDWDSKYRFWRGMISDWTEHKMRCSFSLADLNKAFKRNGRTPACLSVVLQELHRNHEIVPLTEFVRESPSSWSGWAVDTLMKRPIVWSFSVLKNAMIEPVVDADTKYVQLGTVKKLGEIILSTIDNSNENALISLSEVAKNCVGKTRGKPISNDDIKLALTWLRLERKAAFRVNPVCDSSEMLVKLSTSKVKEVTEVEESLYKLEKQEELLTKNLEMLEMEKEAVVKNAKAYLKNGMRQVAKSSLRKKKDIEKSIEKRAAALQNIQIIIARVRDAHSDSEVLTSYKAGAAALKKKLDTDGLTEDNVAETMEDLSEALEEFSEIQSALSRSVDVYDPDLEDELAELLLESPELDESVNNSQSTPIKLKNHPNHYKIDELPDIAKESSSLHLKELPSPPKYSPSVNSPVPSQGE
ncbi:charged multivesicular body protein 7 [Athalia rosae]|uniref:charged multivesicular body protein 7 n=1 Tax=Athalia rosae TaxID=37344 RepID=UPI000625CB16|nr:charged multivesicular body protein 7 [Athalia rosae]XP_048510947.1 charged multivesicular body protein 7 [Athalia rosae]